MYYIDRNAVELDESTGLPKLPKGYFWRVGRKDRDGDHCLYILRGVFPLCYAVKHTWIYGTLTEDKILYQAQDLFIDWSKERGSKNLVGNYPPKTLK